MLIKEYVVEKLPNGWDYPDYCVFYTNGMQRFQLATFESKDAEKHANLFVAALRIADAMKEYNS